MNFRISHTDAQPIGVKGLPVWACLLIVLAATAIAFLVSGGLFYLIDPGEAGYAFFHNADDRDNLLVWLLFAWSYGFMGGVIGLILSSLTVIAYNWYLKS
jgi:hypothetical protein